MEWQNVELPHLIFNHYRLLVVGQDLAAPIRRRASGARGLRVYKVVL